MWEGLTALPPPPHTHTRTLFCRYPEAVRVCLDCFGSPGPLLTAGERQKRANETEEQAERRRAEDRASELARREQGRKQNLAGKAGPTDRKEELRKKYIKS